MKINIKIYPLICLLFFVFNAKAQDTILLEAIKTSDDDKIARYLAEADTTSQVSLKLRFLLESLKLAEKNPKPDLLFKLNSEVGKIYAKEQLNNRALNYFKSAEQYQVDASKVKDLNLEIAAVYDQMGYPDSASIYFRQVLSDYELKQDYDGRLAIHQKLVNTYLNNNEFDKALNENFKIKQLAEARKDDRHLPILYNNIGYNFNYLKEYKRAVEYFKYAESANQKTKRLDLSTLYTNLGIAYNNTGNLSDALTYLQKAKKELGKGQSSTCYLDHLIAQIYLNNKDIFNAQRFNELAMVGAKKYKQNEILVETYNTGALIYQDLYDYEMALEFFKKHLELRDSFRLEDRLRQEQLIQQQVLIERSEKEIKLLMVNQDIQDLAIEQLKLEKKSIESDRARQRSELEAIKKGEEVRIANLKNANLEKETAQKELELTEKRLETERKNRTILVLEQEGKLSAAELEKKQAENERQQAENLQKEKENELLQANAAIYEQNEAISNLEIERQGTRLNFLRLIGGLLLLLSLFVIGSWWNSRKKNKQLANKNKEIEKSRDIIENEKEKSDKLLLNILPKETAQELKEFGFAKPKSYEKVTILFTDFKGFTRLSQHMPPEKLIEELNDCFRVFDDIVNEFGLEKIKTLGDGYMAAGGIPVANETNPLDAVKAALKINEFMKQRTKEKEAAGIPFWGTRIGLHTGNVVAGVVGSRKFAYDIWGDSVNTASRMESGGEVGKVNISKDTFKLIEGHFECEYRGEIEIKNRGKIGMYFVNDKKII